MLLTVILTNLLGFALAIPQPAAAPNAVFCSAVKKVVTSLKQQSVATAYCSSYLKIPKATVTTTVPAKSTITESLTQNALITVTSTSTRMTCPEFETQNAAPSKRAAAVGKPACFSKYTAGAVIASACSCLSVPQATSTVTSTSAPGTTTVTTKKTFTATTTTTVQGRVGAFPTSFKLLDPVAEKYFRVPNVDVGATEITASQRDGTLFCLDAARMLVDYLGGGRMAACFPSAGGYAYVEFASPNFITQSGYLPAKCSAAADGKLTCSCFSDDDVSFNYADSWGLGLEDYYGTAFVPQQAE